VEHRRTADFRSAVLSAVYLSGDADTAATIAEQLAGALYGASGISAEWFEALAWQVEIEQSAAKLFKLSLGLRR
jgi:ADP-ribosyl-[dinitrogen reductase] hydrolase